jgi:AcrR family transcriptional regulator
MGPQTLARASAERRGASRAAAILNATLQLLGEVGYDQLTIDAVVARAGSSKTTIYRRWPDKSALVCAALIAAAQRHPELPSGAPSLREDLLVLIGLMARLGATEDPGRIRQPARRRPKGPGDRRGRPRHRARATPA